MLKKIGQNNCEVTELEVGFGVDKVLKLLKCYEMSRVDEGLNWIDSAMIFDPGICVGLLRCFGVHSTLEMMGVSDSGGKIVVGRTMNKLKVTVFCMNKLKVTVFWLQNEWPSEIKSSDTFSFSSAWQCIGQNKMAEKFYGVCSIDQSKMNGDESKCLGINTVRSKKLRFIGAKAKQKQKSRAECLWELGSVTGFQRLKLEVKLRFKGGGELLSNESISTDGVQGMTVLSFVYKYLSMWVFCILIHYIFSPWSAQMHGKSDLSSENGNDQKLAATISTVKKSEAEEADLQVVKAENLKSGVATLLRSLEFPTILQKDMQNARRQKVRADNKSIQTIVWIIAWKLLALGIYFLEINRESLVWSLVRSENLKVVGTERFGKKKATMNRLGVLSHVYNFSVLFLLKKHNGNVLLLTKSWDRLQTKDIQGNDNHSKEKKILYFQNEMCTDNSSNFAVEVFMFSYDDEMCTDNSSDFAAEVFMFSYDNTSTIKENIRPAIEIIERGIFPAANMKSGDAADVQKYGANNYSQTKAATVRFEEMEKYCPEFLHHFLQFSSEVLELEDKLSLRGRVCHEPKLSPGINWNILHICSRKNRGARFIAFPANKKFLGVCLHGNNQIMFWKGCCRRKNMHKQACHAEEIDLAGFWINFVVMQKEIPYASGSIFLLLYGKEREPRKLQIRLQEMTGAKVLYKSLRTSSKIRRRECQDPGG